MRKIAGVGAEELKGGEAVRAEEQRDGRGARAVKYLAVLLYICSSVCRIRGGKSRGTEVRRDRRAVKVEERSCYKYLTVLLFICSSVHPYAVLLII